MSLDWAPESKKETEQDQRSDAWFEARKRRVGASEMPILLGLSPYKTSHDLWNEKKFNLKSEPTFIQKRGIEAEPAMLKYAQGLQDMVAPGYEVKPQVFMTDHLIASLDGFVEDPSTGQSALFEFKLVGRKYFEEVKKTKKIREDHLLQMYIQLLLSRAKNQIYVINCEGEIKHLVCDSLKFDQKELDKFEDIAKKFIESLELDQNPFPSNDADEKQIEDEVLLSNLQELDFLEQQMDVIAAKKEELRAQIKELVQQNSRCGVYRISYSERKGNVDYSKIPELKSVDLEQYRKPSSKVMTIKKAKEDAVSF